MSIGPSEDTYPGGVYGATTGQTVPPNAVLSPGQDGPRIVELETLYRTVQRYLSTYMLDGAEATTLEDLRHAAWCVEHQQPLPGSAGTPLSAEEYEELKAQAHAALRPEEVEHAMEQLLGFVRDENDPSLEEGAAKLVWDVVVTTAVAVAAWERGRTLPSLKRQSVEASVVMSTQSTLTTMGEMQATVEATETVEPSTPPQSSMFPELDPEIPAEPMPDFPTEPELLAQPDEVPDPETEPVVPSPPVPSALRSKWRRVRKEV